MLSKYWSTEQIISKLIYVQSLGASQYVRHYRKKSISTIPFPRSFYDKMGTDLAEFLLKLDLPKTDVDMVGQGWDLVKKRASRRLTKVSRRKVFVRTQLKKKIHPRNSIFLQVRASSQGRISSTTKRGNREHIHIHKTKVLSYAD